MGRFIFSENLVEAMLGEEDEFDFPEVYEPAYDPKRTHFVFVYGTMRRGHRNHSRLNGSRFIKRALTEPVFTLRSRRVGSGRYLAPVALERGQDAVLGEIYKIAGPVLRNLDIAEGHPNTYVRKKIRVKRLLDGKAFDEPVWMYAYHKGVSPLTREAIIRHGDYYVEFAPNGK